MNACVRCKDEGLSDELMEILKGMVLDNQRSLQMSTQSHVLENKDSHDIENHLMRTIACAFASDL